MTVWTAIPNANLEVDKPIRAIDITNIRNNFLAMAERSAGAPYLNTYNNLIAYASSTTWARPGGVTRARFTVVGAGGGGSGGGSANGYGAGGAGGCVIATLDVTNIASVTITVGAGGGGAAGTNNGGAGGQSAITAGPGFSSASGGEGGVVGGGTGTTSRGGAGGVGASGGTLTGWINTFTMRGGSGDARVDGFPAIGGTSIYSGGHWGAPLGSAWGTGGAAGIGLTGQNGTQGVVIIEY